MARKTPSSFGRDDEIALCVESVLRRRDALTMLIGNSGVGKTSLVNARVLPVLKAEDVTVARKQHPRRWSYSTVRPGRRPLRSMVTAFARHWFLDPTDPLRVARLSGWEQSLGVGHATLSDLVDATVEHIEKEGLQAPSVFVVYIDQFEEIFANEQGVVDRFSELVTSALPDPRISIISSLRADYYGHLQSNGPLLAATERIDVPPLELPALRTVLLRPSQILGARIESAEIIDELIEGSLGQPGALPLLVDLMTDVWRQMQERGDGKLRLYEHRDALRSGSALARRADEFLDRFPELEQQLRRLFVLRLLLVRDRGTPVRVTADLREISEEERKLIRLLADPEWRIVVTGEDDGHPTAEIAHDILLVRWPRLQTWIEEERGFLNWLGQVHVDFQRWTSATDTLKDSALLAGFALGQAKEWMTSRSGDLPPYIEEYVVRSQSTAQRAAETQREQVEMQKLATIGQLAGGVAHDFNNVLTAIIGFADLLLLKHKPGDASFPDVTSIKQSANRAAGLTRQLLAYARRQTLRPQVLEIAGSLDDLTVLLKRLVGDAITLKIDHGGAIWPIKADLVQLEQVVVNLVVNARDAMPDGGTIVVRTSNVGAGETLTLGIPGLPPADYVLIEVIDTGVGMPPEVIERIFEPFFSTKERGKGTGLGLSMVYGIVKQTGGSIYASSEVGKGSRFRIFFTRHVPTEEEFQARVLPRPIRDFSGSERILLVEDEDSVRSFTARALRTSGYEVLEADSGEAALELLDQLDNKIDLMISNVVMPEMDGPALLIKVRERLPALKVVFISGYAEESVRQDIVGSENVEFLAKPFSLIGISEAVRNALGGRAN